MIFASNSQEGPGQDTSKNWPLLGNIVWILGAKFYNFGLYYSHKLFWKFNLKCIYMIRQHLQFSQIHTRYLSSLCHVCKWGFVSDVLGVRTCLPGSKMRLWGCLLAIIINMYHIFLETSLCLVYSCFKDLECTKVLSMNFMGFLHNLPPWFFSYVTNLELNCFPIWVNTLSQLLLRDIQHSKI